MNAGDAAKRPTIMLVDDDPALGTGLTLALGLQGYDVRYERSGADAISAMENGARPDLVLLDVMMPRVDGWQVLTWMRSHPPYTETPVIMLTARDTIDMKTRGFTLGADDYVTKPFSTQELRCRIDAILRRAASGDAACKKLLTVSAPGGGKLLLGSRDIYFIEGIRNYTYVHVYDRRYLCNQSLGSIDAMALPGLMRVHRSYVVNLEKVEWFGWINRSAYRLRLSDAPHTELPVSRNLLHEFRNAMGDVA